MAPDAPNNALPEGIFSLLDTDLYKLTMQCAILKYLPNAREYAFYKTRLPPTLLKRYRGHLCIHESNTPQTTVAGRVQLARGSSSQ